MIRGSKTRSQVRAEHDACVHEAVKPYGMCAACGHWTGCQVCPR